MSARWRSNETANRHAVDGAKLLRLGKARAGRMLDGREWSEMPEVQ